MGAGSGLSGKERHDSLAILIMTMVLGIGIDVLLYMRNGNFTFRVQHSEKAKYIYQAHKFTAVII